MFKYLADNFQLLNQYEKADASIESRDKPEDALEASAKEVAAASEELEEEDLTDELKELLKEAEEELPEDLMEGKHRIK